MTRQTKNQIALDLYGEEYEFLTTEEEVRVTKAFNRQSGSSAGVKATIGRVGVNGTKTCILIDGSTIQDLLDQSGYGFDSNKEKILNNDTGLAVDLDEEAEHNGTYAIAVEITSAK